MSRELWAVEPCPEAKGTEHPNCSYMAHGYCNKCGWLDAAHLSCGKRTVLDFDTIWDRFYKATNRRFKEGLTYNELYFVVYGEKKEESE